MHKYAFALSALTLLILPFSLRACDCDDTPTSNIVHFKDGRSPTAPVTGDPGMGDTEGGCTCSTKFVYRDYGPAHVPTPPTPPDVKQMVKRPSS